MSQNQVRPKFFQSVEFRALNDEWKDKLREEGFRDIERDEDSLQDWSAAFTRHPEWNASKEEYYRLAGQFLYEYRFRGPNAAWTRKIWELHAQGTSIRDIVKILDPKGKQSPHTLFKKVQTTLAVLAKRMIKKCLTNLSSA